MRQSTDHRYRQASIDRLYQRHRRLVSRGLCSVNDDSAHMLPNYDMRLKGGIAMIEPTAS